MPRISPKLALVALLLIGCKSSEQSGGTPKQGDSLSGVWTGLEGPNLSRLSPTARLELTEDAGLVTGYWYSSRVFLDAGFWPVGSLYGFRDGGTLNLRNLAGATVLPDGGIIDGYVFTGTFTPPNHLEAVEVRTKPDGGPLPIYLKLDRTQ